MIRKENADKTKKMSRYLVLPIFVGILGIYAILILFGEISFHRGTVMAQYGLSSSKGAVATLRVSVEGQEWMVPLHDMLIESYAGAEICVKFTSYPPLGIIRKSAVPLGFCNNVPR
ncbi:hypothetical protein [Cypionkella psychrotolerans]|uniref:hypothetical protein n=1 Tax=Cypionkella psychrotolerans TaxID=1678131 RepID=UPI000ABBD9B9|nr:hypothetical protein [Cypionkella psychrotolerans]